MTVAILTSTSMSLPRAGRPAGAEEAFDQRARVERRAAHRRFQRAGPVLDIDAQFVGGRQTQLRELAPRRARRRRQIRPSRAWRRRRRRRRSDDTATSPSASGLRLKRRLAGLARRLQRPRLRAVDRSAGEIDLDFGARFRQRRLDADRRRAVQHRGDGKTELGARGVVERQARARPRLRRSAPLVTSIGDRHAVHLALAGDLQIAVVGRRPDSAPCSSRSLARKLVDAKVGERPVGAKLLVFGPNALAELEIEREIALELSFDRSGIEGEAGVALQRVAAEQIGERVGAALQMGARPSPARSPRATCRERDKTMSATWMRRVGESSTTPVLALAENSRPVMRRWRRRPSAAAGRAAGRRRRRAPSSRRARCRPAPRACARRRRMRPRPSRRSSSADEAGRRECAGGTRRARRR